MQAVPLTERGTATRAVASSLLVLGALVFAVRLGGDTPLWSPDTINDEKFVRTCLDQDACYWFGMGTSVDWALHGANFLHLKTLLRFLGATDTVLHWLLHGMLALAVLFTACSGARLFEGATGIVAALLVPPLLLATDLQMDVTYNHRVLPFLGALVVLLAVRAVVRGRVLDLALAGVLAGLATNIHLECALFAAAVPLVALLLPRARLRAAGLVGGLLAAAAFFTSPDAWVANASALIRGQTAPPLPSPARSPSGFGVAAVAALLVTIGLAFVSRRTRASRRAWLVLPILGGPKVVGTEVAALLGLIEPEAKYYIEVVPVVALTLALPVGLLAKALWTRWLAPARTVAPWPARHALARRTVRALGVVVPGLAIASWPVPPTHGPGSERALALLSDQEIRSLRAFLEQDLGWNQTAMLRGLRGPLAYDALDLLVNLDPGPWQPWEGRQTVTFAKVPSDLIPSPAPEGFVTLASGHGVSLVARVMDSWLDMSRFRVCSGPREPDDSPMTCAETGIARGPVPEGEAPTTILGMPPVRRGQDVRLQVEFAVHYPPNGGEVREVWMPPLRHGCTGRVVAVRGGRSRVLDSGRGALIAPDGDLGSLVLEWRLGTPECGDWAYRGIVPFFVEGDSRAVATWKRLLVPLVEPGGFERD